MKIGNLDFEGGYVGSRTVIRCYKGLEEVWPEHMPPPEPEIPEALKNCLFNFNAKQYDAATRTIPNFSGATTMLNGMRFMNNKITASTEYVSIGGNPTIVESYASTTANPFNAGTGKNLTFIFKASNESGTYHRFFINLEGNFSFSINYMISVANNKQLRLFAGGEDKAVVTTDTWPATFSLTFAGTTVNTKCWNNNTTNSQTVGFGSDSANSRFFCRYTNNDSSELWAGNFYWAFCTNKILTDQEMQEIIDYNNNM